MQCSNIQNNKTSFKSKIEIVPQQVFNEAMARCKGHFVGSPWSYNQIIRAENCYTRQIETCTGGGIVVKNKKGDKEVIFSHLIPPEEEDVPANNDFEAVKAAFLEKIGNDTPIGGLLIGANKHYKFSLEFFERVEDFFKEFKIPYSKFKEQNYKDFVNIAYEGKPDKWTIYSSGVENNGNFSSVFNDFSICDKDDLKMGINFNYII